MKENKKLINTSERSQVYKVEAGNGSAPRIERVYAHPMSSTISVPSAEDWLPTKGSYSHPFNSQIHMQFNALKAMGLNPVLKEVNGKTSLSYDFVHGKPDANKFKTNVSELVNEMVKVSKFGIQHNDITHQNVTWTDGTPNFIDPEMNYIHSGPDASHKALYNNYVQVLGTHAGKNEFKLHDSLMSALKSQNYDIEGFKKYLDQRINVEIGEPKPTTDRFGEEVDNIDEIEDYNGKIAMQKEDVRIAKTLKNVLDLTTK